jgi:hypothetical protein
MSRFGTHVSGFDFAEGKSKPEARSLNLEARSPTHDSGKAESMLRFVNHDVLGMTSELCSDHNNGFATMTSHQFLRNCPYFFSNKKAEPVASAPLVFPIEEAPFKFQISDFDADPFAQPTEVFQDKFKRLSLQLPVCSAM